MKYSFLLVYFGLFVNGLHGQMSITKKYSRSEVRQSTITISENFVRFGDSQELDIEFARFLTWDDIENMTRSYSDDMDTSFVNYTLKDADHPFLKYLEHEGNIMFRGRIYHYPELPKVNAIEIKEMQYVPLFPIDDQDSIEHVLFIYENENYQDVDRKSFYPPMDSKKGFCGYSMYNEEIFEGSSIKKTFRTQDSLLVIDHYIKPPEARRLLNMLEYRGCITKWVMKHRDSTALGKDPNSKSFQYVKLDQKIYEAMEIMPKIDWRKYKIARVVTGSEAELEFDDAKYQSGVAVLEKRNGQK